MLGLLLRPFQCPFACVFFLLLPFLYYYYYCYFIFVACRSLFVSLVAKMIRKTEHFIKFVTFSLFSLLCSANVDLDSLRLWEIV